MGVNFGPNHHNSCDSKKTQPSVPIMKSWTMRTFIEMFKHNQNPEHLQQLYNFQYPFVDN